jgi:DNA repair exonuclease SbcCD ATPase subunit
MIIFKRLCWDYWFSYGKDNEIDLNLNNLTQLIGINGSGKSSIPLIIEEVLYGKNSKSIKKQDLLNRKYPSKSLYAKLDFNIDEDEYSVELSRKTTIKLSLFKNGIDISSHTSKNTYKTLEEIIGLDFKTFSQLFYQTSKSSIEFLTSTDTQRKTFLIALFNLDKYLSIYEIFKEKYKETSKQVLKLQGTCDTINKWIDNNKPYNVNEKPLLDAITYNIQEDLQTINKLSIELENIDKTNKSIRANNQYKNLLNQIDYGLLSGDYKNPGPTDELIREKSKLETQKAHQQKVIKTLNSLDPVCPTCMQQVDIELKNSMLEGATYRSVELQSLLNRLDEKIIIHKQLDSRYKRHIEAVSEFERLNTLIDNSMPNTLLDETDIKEKISELTRNVSNIKNEIDKINNENDKITEYNIRVKLVKQQLEEYKQQLVTQEYNLKILSSDLNYLDILRQSFSTTGLVNYKIEFLVKDLESEINTYLVELTDGKFQIIFSLKDDKLNINIEDNNNIVEIDSLSSGELSRVNTATLLAIRKLMSHLSKTKINILFLDEIMGVLDNYGKDKLIEILLSETELNTFLVSHEFTHPLLEKITILKDDDISRIDNG